MCLKFVVSFISLFWLVGGQSNIVLVLTDDQDIMMDGLKPLKKTRELIAQNGVTFENAFTTTPVCCPSRSSLLTGLYQHNHRVVNNSHTGRCSSFEWQENEEQKTFTVYLRQKGYKTFYAGKYLNEYGTHACGGVSHIPRGWTSWVGLEGNSKYYNYTLSVNGSRVHLTNVYLTGAIQGYSMDFLNNVNDDEPFLMVLAPPAPHAPFMPEPKYKDAFEGHKVPRNVQYNYANNSMKHWIVRMKPAPLPSSYLPNLDRIYASRMETLLSVDDLVESVVQKLAKKRLLDKTYIIFTSDHGFHIGQFSMPWDKRQPYDFDIRVPFLIRGPGIPANRRSQKPVLLIDIAPTILHMAGIKNHNMDGISLLPINENQDRIFLVEYHGEGSNSIDRKCPWRDHSLFHCTSENLCKCQDAKNNTYSCLRMITRDMNRLYCRFMDNENFTEVYDMNADPYQLDNIYKTMDKAVLDELQTLLDTASRCKGQECHGIGFN